MTSWGNSRATGDRACEVKTNLGNGLHGSALASALKASLGDLENGPWYLEFQGDFQKKSVPNYDIYGNLGYARFWDKPNCLYFGARQDLVLRTPSRDR